MPEETEVKHAGQGRILGPSGTCPKAEVKNHRLREKRKELGGGERNQRGRSLSCFRREMEDRKILILGGEWQVTGKTTSAGRWKVGRKAIKNSGDLPQYDEKNKRRKKNKKKKSKKMESG